MNLKGTAIRIANSLLHPLDLTLGRVARDFDGCLDSPKHLKQLFDELTRPIDEWMCNERLFPIRSTPVRLLIEEFYGQYLASPFRQQGGGSRFKTYSGFTSFLTQYNPL